MIWKRKIQIGDRIQIPSDYLEYRGLKKDDLVFLEESGNNLILSFKKKRK